MNKAWLKSLVISKIRANSSIKNALGKHSIEVTDQNGTSNVDIIITEDDINKFEKNPTARIAV